MGIPEKIFMVICILAVLSPLVLRLIQFGLNRYLAKADLSKDKCKKCKGTMIIARSYLYVIPARFREEHEKGAEYYLNNAYSIEEESQIPAGNQACYMHVVQCQSCAHKRVDVVDFLKVRDKVVLQDGNEFPYETFGAFLEERN